MPKKQWSDEERKAFGDKMKAARAKKGASPAKSTPTNNQVKESPVSEEVPSVAEETISMSDYNQLRAQVAELLKNQSQNNYQQQMPQFNQQGGLIGVFEKYIVDPENYPSPVERLIKEPRLKRFNLADNYHFEWFIDHSDYPTKDGRNITEPRFNIELWVNMFDDDGNFTNKRYKIKTMVLHEDPQAAITIAREQGLNVKEWDDSTIDRTQKAFLDEMRYLRIRDWLLDSFFPQVANATKRKREEVIGNRLVEVIEVSSDTLDTRSYSSLQG